jgi:hypothetical protein
VKCLTLNATQCEPYPRAWPGVKCHACEKAGQACGPNTHFRSSMTPSSSTATTRSLAMPFASTPSTSTCSPHLSRSDPPYSPTDTLHNVPPFYTVTSDSSTAIIPNSLPTAPDPASRANLLTLSPDDQAYGRESSVASIRKWYVGLPLAMFHMRIAAHRLIKGSCTSDGFAYFSSACNTGDKLSIPSFYEMRSPHQSRM